MADCVETKVPIVVNGDLIYKIRALRVDLKNCNADKAGLRAWAKEVK
jgi:hypothetical protein